MRYDGTDFSGWQVQPGRRTVQGAIEEALGKCARAHVRIQGAGRTDAGAHALGQVFSCDWPGSVSAERIRRSLNKMLAPEITIVEIEATEPGFHARKSAVAKRYAYNLSLAKAPDPFSARYAWLLPGPVRLDQVLALAQRLVGEHDFAGFQASRASAQNTVRTIHSIELYRGGVIGPMDDANLWRLEFYGSGFLYKMVRNIMGTLISIARGNLPEARLAERLASPGPYYGHTVPAHGLVLVNVEY